MGTRSTTKIYNNGKFLMGLYKQYDGYVDGWGKELKEFIKSGRFVNGLNPSKGKVLFNGVGCFALQLVAKFKTKAGDLYATFEEDYQEYNYKIDVISKEFVPKEIKITCDEDENFNETIKVKE